MILSNVHYTRTFYSVLTERPPKICCPEVSYFKLIFLVTQEVIEPTHLVAPTLGYSDFHNLMGFTSKKTPTHKVRMYKEYHSVCPLVGTGTLPTPLSPACEPLPPEPGGGGGATRPACG